MKTLIISALLFSVHTTQPWDQRLNPAQRAGVSIIKSPVGGCIPKDATKEERVMHRFIRLPVNCIE